MMRTSRVNPKISAYEAIEGKFDYNKTPLAPPGSKVIIHEKPGQRASWDQHGVPGWYLGPATEHYRCYRCYVPKTQAERISDTVEFFPSESKTPKITPTEAAITAAEALQEALISKNVAVHKPELVESSRAALQKLSEIFTTPASRIETGEGPLARVTPSPSPQPVPQSVKGTLPRVAANIPQPIATRTRAATAPTEIFEATTIQNNELQFYANAVLHPTSGKPMTYRELLRDPLTKREWELSSANEFGRLAQGVGGRIKGTDTIRFIRHAEMPPDRKATYPRFVCEHRPQKTEVNRTRLMLGGNLINYPGDVSTRTAELETIKILFNSVISTKGSEFISIDIKNFYLNTPLERPEYVRIPLNLIPQEIIQEYNLLTLEKEGFIMAIVEKGMYGLPQAGILAANLLKKRLEPHGYYECSHTPGLWRHKTRPIMFTLVVDDFGVQVTGKNNAQHLIAALKENYEITVDWDGKLFCGITLDWKYQKGTVDLSMPKYVQEALIEFQHAPPSKPGHQPHRHNPPQFGAKVQMTEPVDTTMALDEKGILRLQQITGKFLYYSRAVDPTMNAALSSLASQQSKATEQTARDAITFLNYCATHPDAKLRYQSSDMILKVHSDASYLSESKARSRAAGHFYMGNKENDDDTTNGSILATTSIMKAVLSSASEAEIGALFENTKRATILRTTLEEMGFPQPPTPVQTDNSTACGIANDNIKQQRSRAIDMRFYWVRDRVKQQQFHIYWGPGKLNLADYYSKHHPPAHHQQMRSIYLYTGTEEQCNAVLARLRGCVKPAPMLGSPSQSCISLTPAILALRNCDSRCHNSALTASTLTAAASNRSPKSVCSLSS
jgi:hypothetical protein